MEWQPTLLEILQPRHFQNHPKREEATRMIVYPQVDRFESGTIDDLPPPHATPATSHRDRHV